MSERFPDGDASRRIAAIDIARGVAVFGMFGYHLTWDLASFGFIARDVPFSPAFRFYSHAVAVTFLFLAGASLVLARRDPFRWDRWGRHLAVIVAAAFLVTIASAVAFPDALITFGILHCIALALLVATPFLFIPAAAAAAAAIIIAALPVFAASPFFNMPALVWTGLNTIDPATNDYRPFFPWAAPVFAGLAILSIEYVRRWLTRIAPWQPSSIIAQGLAFCGRHSLAIYLVHQPIFIGALAALAYVAPPDRGAQAFVEPCVARCAASGATHDRCRPVCACVSDRLGGLGLRDRAVAETLDDAERLILSRVTQACLRSGR